MTKDYVIIFTRDYNILGHKVREVYEQFSDEYLTSNRFEPRCFRCCFYSGQPSYKAPCICQYLRCNGYMDVQPHFELVE